MPALLGCIADDFTGATDLAGMLVGAGMRTVQMIGVPTTPAPDDVDAIVVAIKSRTISAPEAIEQSLAALEWLNEARCRQFYFKYCSTFDSTDEGNIGPVADALMSALDTPFTIACPAFPDNGRTVYKGYLFVGDVLLSESGMQYHPLTPMGDPNLVRVLQRQTQRKIGLVAYDTVAAGADAIRARFGSLQESGIAIAIVDALSNDDLLTLGDACAKMRLVTAGSGLALGLPQNFRHRGLLIDGIKADKLPSTQGLRAVISGSCSSATREQVEVMMAAGAPAFAIDPLRLAADEDVVSEALAWAAPKLQRGPVLVYASMPPEQVKAIQAKLGVVRAGKLVEDAMARIAHALVQLGVRQLIVAGGETSGAVVNELGIRGLRIGRQIDPGVPWTASLGDAPLALALKSGNFGARDFFLKAWEKLT